MAIISQNAIKPGFFVISGPNSGEIESVFHYQLCKTNPILSAVGGLQMNASIFLQMAYEKFIPLAGYKNKPNSNPIKPNLKRAKMNVSLYVIEDYRKKDDFEVRINKPNFVKGQK